MATLIESADNTRPFAVMFAPRLLTERGVLVVGGGHVAARKVRDVLAVGGRLTLVAPEIAPEITDLAAAQPDLLTLHVRPYRTGDVAATTALLVIAATSVRAVNAAVADEANAAGRLVNVVDDISRCDFIVPSPMYRGEITLAVATSAFVPGDEAGASPALAAHLRRRVEEAVGPEYGELARLMREMRPAVKERVDATARPALWRAIIAGDALRLLREGDSGAAWAVVAAMIDDAAHDK